MRIMGLDYGSKTIGVAVSDPMGLTAQGIETITREEENKLRKSLRRIEELVEQYQVEEIVLGFPKNMNNTIGERAYYRRSGPHTDRGRRTKREQKKICGYDSCCIYTAGLFGCKSKPGHRLISA